MFTKNTPHRLIRFIAPVSILMLTAAEALAHTGHGSTSGFASGAYHPVSGWDHLLAMVAIGLLAVQMGGRMLWAAPLAFVSSMALGAALGMAGLPLPLVELGIVASVLAFGIVLAIGKPMPQVAALVLIGAFAIFHGHAHGAEMPTMASGFIYGIGFVLATASLHLGGIVFARLSTSWLGDKVLRIAGGLIALAGAALAV